MGLDFNGQISTQSFTWTEFSFSIDNGVNIYKMGMCIY